jgi:hypothetical protein
MKSRRRSPLARIIVTALLMLAVSPVTAPFLTFNLEDLFGGSTSSGVALVQPKTTHDDPVSAVAINAALQVLGSVRTPAATTIGSCADRSTAFLTPLRI